MSANPSTPTNGNVAVSITYSTDTIVKEYSLDSTNWNSYTSPVEVTNNGITVYARGKDVAGNISGVATLTVNNIDRNSPTVAYGTDGATNIQTASTTVTVTDVGTSNVNASTLQYIWDTQNATEPTSGWTAFTNAAVVTKTGVTGTYYLWIKASDNAGNNVVSKTNAFYIDNTGPTNPTMSANPSTWTNGNVTVTATYSADSVTKEYSTDGTTWQVYTIPLVVTTNGTTIHTRATDSIGNQSGQSTLTVSNIDKVPPTVTLENPSSLSITPVQSVTIPMTITENGSGIDESTINSTNITVEKVGITAANLAITGTGNNRTITINNIVGEGSFTVKVNGIKDSVGNTLVSQVVSQQVFVAVPMAQIPNSIITANSNRTPYGTSSPQKLFDGNTSSNYQSYGCYINNITFPLHINFILDAPKKIYKMRYFTYDTPDRYQPIDFSIQGSNDTTNGTDGTWTTIKTYTNYPTNTGGLWGEFIVGSTVEYKAYKMNITKTYNIDTQFLYNEMELYEYQ